MSVSFGVFCYFFFISAPSSTYYIYRVLGCRVYMYIEFFAIVLSCLYYKSKKKSKQRTLYTFTHYSTIHIVTYYRRKKNSNIYMKKMGTPLDCSLIRD